MLGEMGEVNWRRQPAGRHRKNWNYCVLEDMNLLGVKEHVVQDPRMWRTVITHRKNVDIKQE